MHESVNLPVKLYRISLQTGKLQKQGCWQKANKEVQKHFKGSEDGVLQRAFKAFHVL